MSRIDLSDLSPCGLMALELADALKFPERARYVSMDAPSKKVLKLKRLYKLDLWGPPPSWIGELKHLRMIKCSANIKKLPPALLSLPKLRYLHFDDSALESLDGLEQLRSLDTITLGRTPVQDKEGALAAAAAKVGGRASSWSIAVDRKGKKFKRLDDDTEDFADLRGTKLQGTFEDLYITHDLRGAKLAGTTWRNCDFQFAKLDEVDITGATFDRCYFGMGVSLEKAKASKATFTRCGGTLELASADLREARFVDMESDVRYFMDKANAAGIELSASFCSEREHQIKAKGTDLRGAKVYFDITPDRRAEILKKKSSKFAWAKDHLKGAKTDKTTSITYADLGVAKPSKSSVDPKGPTAKALGSIHAPNAGLWLLAIDAADAGAWRGAVDENDKHDDFQRALRGDGPIKVGKATGLIFAVNHTNGWSHVWQVDGGIALLDWSMSIDKKLQEKELGLRLAQWPMKKPAKLGSVKVHSGVLALMLPYRDGVFADADLKKAKKALVADKEHDRVLVPLANGTYKIVVHDFGPVRRYEDELGAYYTVTRIVQS